jgi:hypothetical protein
MKQPRTLKRINRQAGDGSYRGMKFPWRILIAEKFRFLKKSYSVW